MPDWVLAKTARKKGIADIAVWSWFAFVLDSYQVKLDRKIIEGLV
jgi:hypothetical protein